MAVSAPSLGNQRPRGEVERKACTTKERQHDEGDPNVRDVEGEECGEPGGDTAEAPSIDGTPKAPSRS